MLHNTTKKMEHYFESGCVISVVVRIAGAGGFAQVGGVVGIVLEGTDRRADAFICVTKGQIH